MATSRSPPSTACSGSPSTWPPSARSSLRFLAYLARRLEGQPILVPATVRTNEPGTDVALLGEIAHDPATVSIRPVPLSADAVRALVRERLGGDAEEPFC